MGARLAGKVVIITGGGRGIGRAIAIACAREGASVLVASRTEEELAETAGEILAFGGRVLAVRADVSHEQNVQHMVAETVEKWGRIDVLVNNAGISGPQGLVHEFSLSNADETWAVNLRGPILCSRAVVPLMLQQAAGNIINVSSGAGQRKARPRVRSLPYQVSKFALEGLTNAMAVQFRDAGINVNALQPGRIATRVHNVRPGDSIAGLRLGLPEDVVPAALFLATLAPGAMTGFSLEAPLFNRGFRPELRDYTID